MTNPAKDGEAVSLNLNFEDEIIDKSALTHAGSQHTPSDAQKGSAN
jgi:NAD(P) transhydrogenase subunit alpha